MYDVHRATCCSYPWACVRPFLGNHCDQCKEICRESTASRLYQVLFMTVCFAPLFRHDMRIGQLGTHVLPASAKVVSAALVLTGLGAAFAIWTRLTLGRTWSTAVSVKKEHSIVYRGPYRVVRYRIYAAIPLATLGTATVYDEADCFLAVVLAFVSS